jgi:hypothetical protein
MKFLVGMLFRFIHLKRDIFDPSRGVVRASKSYARGDMYLVAARYAEIFMWDK